MTIPKKRIRKMTTEEVLGMTDDELMQKLFGKKVREELQKAAGKEPGRKPKKT